MKGTSEEYDVTQEIWHRRRGQLLLADLNTTSNRDLSGSTKSQAKDDKLHNALSHANFYNNQLGNFRFPWTIKPHHLNVVMKEEDPTLTVHYNETHNNQDEIVIGDLATHLERLHNQSESLSPESILPSKEWTQQRQKLIDEWEELHDLHQHLQEESKAAGKQAEALSKLQSGGLSTQEDLYGNE